MYVFCCGALKWRAVASLGRGGRNPTLCRTQQKTTLNLPPGALLFTSLADAPLPSSKYSILNIDEEMVYVGFFADFGPLNLGKVKPACWMK